MNGHECIAGSGSEALQKVAALEWFGGGSIWK